MVRKVDNTFSFAHAQKKKMERQKSRDCRQRKMEPN